MSPGQGYSVQAYDPRLQAENTDERDRVPFESSDPRAERIGCSSLIGRRWFPTAVTCLRTIFDEHCRSPDERLAHVGYDDGTGVAVCVPSGSGCLDADVEDVLDSVGNLDVQWYPARRPWRTKVEWPHSGRRPVAGVCLDGPLDRAGPRLLRRTARALEDGVSIDFRVVVSAASGSASGCRLGRRLYQSAFGDALVGYLCHVDNTMSVLRQDFLDEAANASWWERNEHRFLVKRSGDPDLTLWTVIRNLQMRSTCLDALEDAEAARGSQFDWLVYLRNDFDFFAPHPPLAFMARSGGIWIPDGEDYVGLNDRWAVLERRYARAYFRRLEAFLDGTAIREFDPVVRTHHLDVELIHVLRLYRMRIWPYKVHRFTGVAARRCVVRSRGCPLRMVTGLRSDQEVGWRSIAEWSDAYSTASRLQLDNWGWRLKGPRRFYPTCMTDDIFRLCGGKPDAGTEFDGVFHTHARCCADLAGVLMPWPSDAGALAPPCWTLIWMQRTAGPEAAVPWTVCVPIDTSVISTDESGRWFTKTPVAF